MPQPIGDQVEARIRKVEEAANKALFALSKKTSWFGGMTTEAESSASAVRSLVEDNIDPWAARGRKHAATDTEPSGRGWVGWTDAGNEFLARLPEIEGMADTGRLENIQATVVQTMKTTVELPGKALKGAATAIGEGADSLISPIFGKLLVVAGIALVGGWIYLKGR